MKTNLERKTIIINCMRTPLNNTLGVVNVLMHLAERLHARCDVFFVVPELNKAKHTPHWKRMCEISVEIIDYDSALHRFKSTTANCIELLPHQFQEQNFNCKSVIICHDLHIFDVGWKYSDLNDRKIKFKKNLVNADAVITHFPRTYYRVELISEIYLHNLFLTESPLMLNIKKLSEPVKHIINNSKIVFLYPAQLQEHKNHEKLFNALAKLPLSNCVELICPGSFHSKEFKNHLEKIIKKIGIEDRVKLLGHISDDELYDLYKICDVVIVPSLAEGGAYIAMEAICAGKPVAINQIESAILHLKTVNANVCFFDGKDTDSIVSSMKYLMNPINRKNLVISNNFAKNKIRELSWDNVSKKWFDILDYVVGKSKKPNILVNHNASEIVYE